MSLRDRYGRQMEYLRLSVTEGCNLRCIYCSPDACNHSIRQPALSPHGIERIVKAMATHGLKKVRITGGEPLIREDLPEIIRRISSIPGIEETTLTTNGVLLAEQAMVLKAAGLMRVNVSLDTLKPERMKRIAGKDCLDKVLDGIREALRIGLAPVRTNTVLMKGINDDEVEDFIHLARKEPMDVRFIELMPMGELESGRGLTGCPERKSFKGFLNWCRCREETSQKPKARQYIMEERASMAGLVLSAP